MLVFLPRTALGRLCNRLYYACFYAVSALLVRDGMSSSKHAGVRGLFHRQFVKTGSVPKELAAIYKDLFERRQEGDYVDLVNFSESQVIPWIPSVEELADNRVINGLDARQELWGA
ncbi:MAG: HEPN domain-containing protein [Thermodesulfobacteriota bacterium]